MKIAVVGTGYVGLVTGVCLADLVIKKTNTKSKVVYLPLPGDDPTQRKPDISLAQKLLKWQPKIKLEDGLDRTIEYFSQQVLQNQTPNIKTPKPLL